MRTVELLEWKLSDGDCEISDQEFIDKWLPKESQATLFRRVYSLCGSPDENSNALDELKFEVLLGSHNRRQNVHFFDEREYYTYHANHSPLAPHEECLSGVCAAQAWIRMKITEYLGHSEDLRDLVRRAVDLERLAREAYKSAKSLWYAKLQANCNHLRDMGHALTDGDFLQWMDEDIDRTLLLKLLEGNKDEKHCRYLRATKWRRFLVALLYHEKGIQGAGDIDDRYERLTADKREA